MKLSIALGSILLLRVLAVQEPATPVIRKLTGHVIAFPTGAAVLDVNGFLAHGSILLARVADGKGATEIVKLVSSGAAKSEPARSTVEGRTQFTVKATRNAECDETRVTIMPPGEITAQNLNSSRYIYNRAGEHESVTLGNVACYRVIPKKPW